MQVNATLGPLFADNAAGFGKMGWETRIEEASLKSIRESKIKIYNKKIKDSGQWFYLDSSDSN